LKFVYQIQTTLREWQQQAPEAQPATAPEDRNPSPAPKPAANGPAGRT